MILIHGPCLSATMSVVISLSHIITISHLHLHTCTCRCTWKYNNTCTSYMYMYVGSRRQPRQTRHITPTRVRDSVSKQAVLFIKILHYAFHVFSEMSSKLLFETAKVLKCLSFQGSRLEARFHCSTPYHITQWNTYTWLCFTS